MCKSPISCNSSKLPSCFSKSLFSPNIKRNSLSQFGCFRSLCLFENFVEVKPWMTNEQIFFRREKSYRNIFLTRKVEKLPVKLPHNYTRIRYAATREASACLFVCLFQLYPLSKMYTQKKNMIEVLRCKCIQLSKICQHLNHRTRLLVSLSSTTCVGTTALSTYQFASFIRGSPSRSHNPTR